MDIKNTMEALQLVRDGLVAYKVAKEDGVSWLDLLKPEVRALIPGLQEALKDGKLIPKELAELDPAEAMALYEKLSEIVIEAIGLFMGVEG